MKRKILEAISSALQARINCDKGHGNNEWFVRHGENIESWVKEHLPRGSGFDAGTTFDFDASRPDRLVFNTAFHHMDDGGGYDGWTEHQVIATPSFIGGFAIRVTGVNRNGIKEFIADTFNHVFSSVEV